MKPDMRADFSASIDLKRLERETRALLRFGFLFGTVSLIILCLGVRFEEEPARMTAKTVPTRIVADIIPIPPLPRDPVRVSSPERKKPYRMRPSFRPVFPRISGYGRMAAIPDAAGDGIRADLERRAEDISEKFLSSLNVDEGVSPAPTESIPLPEYLVIDNGASSAEVVIPPGRKMAIQGYLRIPYAWGGRINTADTLCVNNIRILASAMNRSTNIRTEAYEHRIRLDGRGDTRPFPFIYIAADAPFELTDDEIAALAMHRGYGCLIVIDNVAEDDRMDIIGQSVQKFTDKLLARDSWGGRIIPPNHPLYHCFFDIPAPLSGNGVASRPMPEHLRLVGYFAGERTELAVVYCSRGLCRPLANPRNEDIRRLAVNMVVFALTRYQEWYVPRTDEFRYVTDTPTRSW